VNVITVDQLDATLFDVGDPALDPNSNRRCARAMG
jgi:hypothetical protein